MQSSIRTSKNRQTLYHLSMFFVDLEYQKEHIRYFKTFIYMHVQSAAEIIEPRAIKRNALPLSYPQVLFCRQCLSTSQN